MTNDREALMGIYWDLYKDVHGFRPRHIKFDEMPTEVLQSDIQYMINLAEQQEIEQKERQHRAVVKFETTLRDIAHAGANDRSTALRWLRDAQKDPYAVSNDYMEWEFDLPYGYLKKAS